ncbi:MAG: hypothetical protein B0A82_23265 [Alkalinema sp. CACIAM 70d]|nr:MAG: hypothetical protein B0A82_23265 [Alkalinema sp. CACIAM 70d]
MISRAMVSFQQMVKRAMVLLLVVVMFLGLMQPAVQAATTDTAKPQISPEKLEQMKAERREEQSKVSQAAAENAEKEMESVGDKLNLGEIVNGDPAMNDSSTTGTGSKR